MYVCLYYVSHQYVYYLYIHYIYIYIIYIIIYIYIHYTYTLYIYILYTLYIYIHIYIYAIYLTIYIYICKYIYISTSSIYCPWNPNVGNFKERFGLIAHLIGVGVAMDNPPVWHTCAICARWRNINPVRGFFRASRGFGELARDPRVQGHDIQSVVGILDRP